MAKDSNGTTLNAGDSVSVIKDLKVKGAKIQSSEEQQ
ncbi:PhnA domain-containing protein [Helicobacter bilis]